MILQWKIVPLKSKANVYIKRRDAQYKRHYNVKVPVKPKFIPIQRMFVDKLPLTGNDNTAEEIGKANYNKLWPQMVTSFQIIKAQPRKVVISRKEVSNMVLCTESRQPHGWEIVILKQLKHRVQQRTKCT